MSTVNKNTTEENKNNIEVLDKELDKEFSGKTKSMTKQEAAKKFLDDMVYMDNVKQILDVAMVTGENVILYGPGGYGKSESSLAFFQSKGIDPYIITLGSGTTVDRLFGGVDLPKFNTTGKLEYLVENSFMNHEYVIFEELFDAPDYILEPLKDILSRGVFTNGNQVFEIKTKLIISCTNKERTEFSKNNSLKALMERFPLETKVVWKDHNRITYENLFKTKFGGHSDAMLTYILEEFAKAGTTISPRIALKAYNIINQCGPDSINFIADFNGKSDILKTAIGKFKSLKEVTDLVKTCKEITDKYVTINKSTTAGVTEGTKLNNQLHKAIESLKSIKADDAVAEAQAKARKTYEEIYNKNKKELEFILVVDDSESNPF
jgi:hypothetical protein